MDNKLYSFANQPDYLDIALLYDLLGAADVIVGHNILSFDLRKLAIVRPGWTYDPTKVFDTMVVARTEFPQRRLFSMDSDGYFPGIVGQRSAEGKSLYGSHSLEAWGHRTGTLKGGYGKTTNWANWCPEMSQYCDQDAAATKTLYEFLVEWIKQEYP
jgi:hypothetical protein